MLAGVALEKRGQTKRNILNAMRTWCKENDITTSRACIFAIARAVIALKNSPGKAREVNAAVAVKSSAGNAPSDAAASISRGKASYTGSNHCVNCHQTGGRGGPRAPSLADNEWIHCDGSIEGIKKVILAGVPKNRMKNKTHPFPMAPATNLASNDKELADLAAYVHSLSRH